jgi:hypothetical protein
MDYSLDQLLQIGANPKVSIPSVSLRQEIKEAQAAMADTSTPEQKANKAAEKSRAAVALARTNRNMEDRPLGVSQSEFEATKGTGPEAADFKLIAASDPAKAAQMVDEYAQRLHAEKAAPAPGSDAFYRGTMAAPSDGAEIPYFTNLAPGMRDTRAHDFQKISPGREGTGGFVSGENTGAQDASDPRMRTIVERIREGRNEIAYGKKSDDVVASEVSRRMPSALKDLQNLGPEAASNKWLKDVESGHLSDAAYRRLHAETADAAKRADESEYAQLREKYISVAKDRGVSRALDVVNKNRRAGKDDPSHLKRIEAELAERGRTSMSPDAIASPDAFLPLGLEDARSWKTGLGPSPTKGGKVDTQAPPTIFNTHNGLTTVAQGGARAETSVEQLKSAVQSPEMVGTPARSAASYTATEGAPQKNKPNYVPYGGSGGEIDTANPVEYNAPFIPKRDETKSPWGFLAGSGEAVGQALEGVTAAAGGHESKAERERRLKREAVKRKRGY